MGCHRCGYEGCECSACAACDRWVWSELLTRNEDRDWVCQDCIETGHRSPDAIAADQDNDLIDTPRAAAAGDDTDQEATAA